MVLNREQQSCEFIPEDEVKVKDVFPANHMGTGDARNGEDFLVIPAVSKAEKSKSNKRGGYAASNKKGHISVDAFVAASNGSAMDVIVVRPTEQEAISEVTDGGNSYLVEFSSSSESLVSSSDFYALFPLVEDNGLLSSIRRLSLTPSASSLYKRSVKKDGASKKQSSLEITSSGEETLPSEVTDSLDEISLFINGTEVHDLRMHRQPDGICTFIHGEDKYKPSRDTLRSLVEKGVIRDGKNSLKYVMEYSTSSSTSSDASKRSIKYFLECSLFLWDSSDSIIVSDIDGTITKSDVGGVMDTVVTERYTHAHKGVCRLYTELNNLASDGQKVDTTSGTEVVYVSPNYSYPTIHFVYLTSRPIALLDSTRKFVRSLQQRGNWLPEGPVFCHKGTLSEVLYTELVKKNTFEFKSDVIEQQVNSPFCRAGRRRDDRLIVAGFGNKDLDAVAYEMAGISKEDIYIINTKSEITCSGTNCVSQTSTTAAEDDIMEQTLLPQNLRSNPRPNGLIRRAVSADADDPYNSSFSPDHSFGSGTSTSFSFSGKKRAQSSCGVFRMGKSVIRSTSNIYPESAEISRSFEDQDIGDSSIENGPSLPSSRPASPRRRLSRKLMSSLRKPSKLRRNLSDTLFLSRSEMGIFKSYSDPLLVEVIRSKLMKVRLHDLQHIASDGFFFEELPVVGEIAEPISNSQTNS